MPPSARNACVGADARIGPPTGLAGGCLFRVISRSRPQCRAGVFARRLGSAASQGLQDDASIVPYGCRARPCRGLRDTCGARPPAGVNARPTMQGKQAAEPGGGRPPHAPVRSQRLRRGRCSHRPADGPGGGLPLPRYLPFPAAMQGGRFRPPLGVCGIAGFAGRCQHRPLRMQGKALPGSAGYLWGKAAMHPSVCALRRIHLPLQGRLWGDRHPEGSPVRGAVGVSRLRGAAPCLANTLPGRRKAPGGRERPPYNAR